MEIKPLVSDQEATYNFTCDQLCGPDWNSPNFDRHVPPLGVLLKGKFWFSDSRVRPETLWFCHAPGSCWSCWPVTHTLQVASLNDLLGSADTTSPVWNHHERDKDNRSAPDKAERPMSVTKREAAFLFPGLLPQLEVILLELSLSGCFFSPLADTLPP